MTVAGGTPTLTLNDGGTATYASGSGTNALVFDTTVAAGQNAASLAATALNLPTGVTIADSAGNAASLSLSGLDPDRTADRHRNPRRHRHRRTRRRPARKSAGKTMTLTLNFSEAVTVAGGTPTLTLNDGGTATYASGSGTNALDLRHHRRGGRQRRLELAATAVNLPTGVTITDGAGNAANMAGALTTFTGLSVDPAVTKVTETFTTGATITSSDTGPSSGVLTLTTGANGLTVDVGESTLSVAAGHEVISLRANSTESIVATGRTNDTFVFTPHFGSDTVTGLAVAGANHDTVEFSASMFSYLTPGMSQAQDLAAVLSHATSSGGTTTISDSVGDKLALTAISATTLAANPADFKFVLGGGG